MKNFAKLFLAFILVLFTMSAASGASWWNKNTHYPYHHHQYHSVMFQLAVHHQSKQLQSQILATHQFINYIRTGGGDYHLQEASPAIDKGSLTYTPAKDLDGVSRPVGAGADIGAYER